MNPDVLLLYIQVHRRKAQNRMFLKKSLYKRLYIPLHQVHSKDWFSPENHQKTTRNLPDEPDVAK
jgi:hypothetical protein